MKTLRNKSVAILLAVAMLLSAFCVCGVTVSAESAGEISFEACTYGTAKSIQVRTNLPGDTPCASFLASSNGSNIDQSANEYQQFGWAGMVKGDDGKIYITFNFNKEFSAGQTYTVGAGSVFGFTNGKTYTLDAGYTFTFDGANWTMNAEAPLPPAPATVSFEYSYGNVNTIQVRTDLPGNTPCVNFLASDNGCEIDQSANQYQQFGWAGMVKGDDGKIYIAFNFNGGFLAGQTYTIAAGSVFGFTNGKKYELDATYTFTFDGNGWTAEKEVYVPSVAFTALVFGNGNTLQVKTDLPHTTPIANFLATDNGCALLESGNQSAGWFGMAADENGDIYISCNFNANFTAGQTYTLGEGSVFGFTDGTTYKLDKDYVFSFDGENWDLNGSNQPQDTTLSFLNYQYGTADLIQVKTNLPSSASYANFTMRDNGFSVDESRNKYQQSGWVGVDVADGYVFFAIHFNNAFEAGQTYYLPKDAVLTFGDVSYTLDRHYVFFYDGATWRMSSADALLAITEFSFGTDKVLQVATDLPMDTPCADFLATDNGCVLLQSGDHTLGWIGMGADTSVKLAFNFNEAYTAGQTYTLSEGSVFGFTDGKTYMLDGDYTFRFEGASWSVNPTEPATPNSNVYGDTNGDGVTDVRDLVHLKKVLAGSASANNQCDMNGDGNMDAADVTLLKGYILGIVEEPARNSLEISNFLGGNSFLTFADLPVDARDPEKINEYKALGFNTSLLTDDIPGNCMNAYRVDCTTANQATKTNPLVLNYRYTNGKCLQFETNLPASGTYANFLTSDAGFSVIQSGAQSIGWVGMLVDNGTVYMTLQFNDYFDVEDTFALGVGSTFRFGGTTYTLDRTYNITVRNDWLTSLRNIDAAGLNVWIRNYNNQSSYFTPEFTSVLKKYENVIDGFYMADESFQTAALKQASGQTNAGDFEDMLNMRAWAQQNFPNAYFHTNQVPMSSYDHYAGNQSATNYKSFLNDYISKFVAPAIAGKSVCYDCYPFTNRQYTSGSWFWQTTTSGIGADYLENMLAAAECARDYNGTSQNGKTDFGICVQTFEATAAHSSRDIVSASEVSFQLYTGMALGARLFEYFIYNSGSGMNGILAEDGSHRLYDLVQTANADAFSFAKLITEFDWQGINTSLGTVNSANSDAFSRVSGSVLSNAENGKLSAVSSTDDAIVGYLTKGNYDGYMVVNYNDPQAVTGNNSVTLQFANATAARVFVAQDGQLTSSLVELNGGAYTATLAPGSACFVIPA